MAAHVVKADIKPASQAGLSQPVYRAPFTVVVLG